MKLRQSYNIVIALLLVACADLGVIKSDAPDPVLLGQDITYTIQITNSGPDAATGIILTDSLPGTVSFISAVPTQGTCTEAVGIITCLLGNLANGGTASVTVLVNTTGIGLITNSVTVTSGVTDPNLSNNSATEDTTVDPAADLVINKTDSPDPVLAGNNLTYSLSVTNTGPSDASGVTLADTLPALVSFGSAIPSQGSCSESGGVVTCDLGIVASGGSTAVLLVVNVDPLASGILTNTASIIGNEADPNTLNNSASEDTSVSTVADLALAMIDLPDPILAGNNLNYTITISNSGPSTSFGVTVIDTLPAGVTFNSAVSTQGICSEFAGVVTCPIGLVTTSSFVSIIINVNVDPTTTGIISNTANVSAIQVDPNISNNTATETTSITEPLLPGTGFAPGRVSKFEQAMSENIITSPSDYWLEIPNLDLNLPIVGVPLTSNGWDVSWLTSQAGYLEGTAHPTWEGNTVITAHNFLSDGLPGPFVDLGELMWGDTILIHSHGQSYKYVVRTVKLLSLENASHITHEEYDWLTLITCKDYDENSNSYLNRVVIRAVLVLISDP